MREGAATAAGLGQGPNGAKVTVPAAADFEPLIRAMSSPEVQVGAFAEPLISICVPTFNRAGGLRSLFSNLQEIKARFGSRVEICVSNNHSTDETAEVIAEWQEILDMRVLHQTSNVGATLNIIAVTRLCTGKWTMHVGDDDGLLADNFGMLLEQLETASPEDWVLVGVADTTGREHLLGGLKQGIYSNNQFKLLILKTSLHCYGFMGMHVFPASARPVLWRMSLEEAKPWPPIALFLRELENGSVHVFKKPVIVQAKAGVQLFWNAADIAKVTLSRLRIIDNVKAMGAENYFFSRLLMLRELYSMPNLGLLLAWRLYEDADFRLTAVPLFFAGYRRTGAFVPLTALHLTLVALLRLAPHSFLRAMSRLVGREHYITRYASRKSELKAFDGISRGL